jgi:hypothetical protein
MNIFERLQKTNYHGTIKEDLLKLKETDNSHNGFGTKIDKTCFETTILLFIENKVSELPDHKYIIDKRDIFTKSLEENYFFIQKFNLDKSAKIAVVGDIHGGFLNLLNFIIQLIDVGDFFQENTLILKTHRYIVSLGDLVDRGSRNLEVVWFLCNLYNINYDTTNPIAIPKVILINGNHETSDMFSENGFLRSLLSIYKIGNRTRGLRHGSNHMLRIYKDGVQEEEVNIGTKKSFFFIPFLYLPVGVFIQIGDNKPIQYCHGGIDDSYLDISKYPTFEFNETIQSLYKFVNGKISFKQLNTGVMCGFRWSDFKSSTSSNITYTKGRGYIFTEKHVQDYITKLGLQCIIRGHQDYTNGFMLLGYSNTKNNTKNNTIEAYVYRTNDNYYDIKKVNRFTETIKNTYIISSTPFTENKLRVNKSYEEYNLKSPVHLASGKYTKFDVSNTKVLTLSTAREVRGKWKCPNQNMEVESFAIVYGGQFYKENDQEKTFKNQFDKIVDIQPHNVTHAKGSCYVFKTKQGKNIKYRFSDIRKIIDKLYNPSNCPEIDNLKKTLRRSLFITSGQKQSVIVQLHELFSKNPYFQDAFNAIRYSMINRYKLSKNSAICSKGGYKKPSKKISKKISKKKSPKLHIGPRGGKYIVKKGKKIYQ